MFRLKANKGLVLVLLNYCFCDPDMSYAEVVGAVKVVSMFADKWAGCHYYAVLIDQLVEWYLHISRTTSAFVIINYHSLCFG